MPRAERINDVSRALPQRTLNRVMTSRRVKLERRLLFAFGVGNNALILLSPVVFNHGILLVDQSAEV